jgi:hypothetical protein
MLYLVVIELNYSKPTLFTKLMLCASGPSYVTPECPSVVVHTEYDDTQLIRCAFVG